MISPLVHLGHEVEVTNVRGEVITRGTLINRALPLVMVRIGDALSPGDIHGFDVRNYHVKRIMP